MGRVTVSQLMREAFEARVKGRGQRQQGRTGVARAEEGRTLFVGNLAYAATEDEIRDLVKEAAGVAPVAVRIGTDRETGKPRGFAFIEFSTVAEATEAKAQLNSQEFMGRQIRVTVAESRR